VQQLLLVLQLKAQARWTVVRLTQTTASVTNSIYMLTHQKADTISGA